MKRNIVILTVLFIFCFTLSALAADKKVYPGSMGVRSAGSTDPLPDIYYTILYNPSTTTSTTSFLSVVLPAVRDNAGSIASAWVKVIDRHYDEGHLNDNIRCRMYCYYMNSSGSASGYYSKTIYSFGSNNATQTLNLGSLNTWTDAPIYIDCLLPPTYNGNKSGIVSYSVTENDPTM